VDPADISAPTPLHPLLADVTAARRMLGGVGVTHFYKLCRLGRIRIVHLGRRSFVAVRELEQLVDELLAEATE